MLLKEALSPKAGAPPDDGAGTVLCDPACNTFASSLQLLSIMHTLASRSFENVRYWPNRVSAWKCTVRSRGR